MRISHLLIYVFLLAGLFLLGGHGMASGYDRPPREHPRHGLVDGALDLAGNCFCAAAHGGLGRLLPKESMGWHLGL